MNNINIPFYTKLPGIYAKLWLNADLVQSHMTQSIIKALFCGRKDIQAPNQLEAHTKLTWFEGQGQEV